MADGIRETLKEDNPQLYKLYDDKRFQNRRILLDQQLNVVLTTMHKSKGLEFDIVFHLNMCEWELPFRIIKDNDFNNPLYPNWEQDLNLHYVGVTRARKACFLVRGTQRTNNRDILKMAKDSEFLSLNGIEVLRKDYWYGL